MIKKKQIWEQDMVIEYDTSMCVSMIKINIHQKDYRFCPLCGGQMFFSDIDDIPDENGMIELKYRCEVCEQPFYLTFNMAYVTTSTTNGAIHKLDSNNEKKALKAIIKDAQDKLAQLETEDWRDND